MSVQVLSYETHREWLSTATRSWKGHGRVNTGGRAGPVQEIDVTLEKGQVRYPKLRHDLGSYWNTQGEIVAVPANLHELIPRLVIDMEISVAQIPMLYTPIYRTRNVPWQYEFVDVAGMVKHTGVVFLERGEGEEIHWGHRERGAMMPVPIRSFAGGFQWTKEFARRDPTYLYQDWIDAIGRAHAALMNHLHLWPIITYGMPPGPDGTIDPTGPPGYPDANPGPPAPPNPAPPGSLGNVTRPDYAAMVDPADVNWAPWIQVYRGLEAAIRQAQLDISPLTGEGRRPSVLLCHPVNEMFIRRVLGGFDALGFPPMPGLAGITQIILWPDYVIFEGQRPYRYPGCPTDRVFLIQPNDGFISLIQQPLLIETGDGDFVRYLEQAIRFDTYLGVAAAPQPYVQVLMLPESLGTF